MNPELQRETEGLTRSWMQYDDRMLVDYLVAGVEDPRINVQSVLTRHFLTVLLFGNRFQHLQEEELRFAVTMNWLDQFLKTDGGPDQVQALRHALQQGADNAEGTPIPGFLYADRGRAPNHVGGLGVPEYLSHALRVAEVCDPAGRADVLDSFARSWRELLATESARGISVLEPACGSANDYRFLDKFGLARLCDYSAFDLCEKNIRNARQLFPDGYFWVGNVLSIAAADGAFAYTFVHDLFEHLSSAGLECALAEICRVTREGLCLGFFNLHEGEEHLIQPVDEYHWNRLSVPRLRDCLEHHGFEVQVVHIGTFLRWRCGCNQTHNPNAYTLLAGRQGSPFLSSPATPDQSTGASS